jgi:hypothetical protein
MKGTTRVGSEFLVGVTLAGYRQPDGSITQVGGSSKLKSWPETLTVEGVTFTFESEEFVGSLDDPNCKLFCAEYA